MGCRRVSDRVASAGLYYNYFRYYDAHLGRYLTSDPLGLFDGNNTYLYAYASPGRHVDPQGLFVTPQTVGGTVGFLFGLGYSRFVNGNSWQDAFFDGAQAGAAGLISGGASVFTGFMAAASANAVRSMIECGQIDYVDSAMHGGFAMLGGYIGGTMSARVVPKKMITLERGFLGRVAQRMGLIGPKQKDLNAAKRANLGAAFAATVENLFGGFYSGPSSDGDDCECDSKE